jgi:phosphonate transport system substrate-binding protein
MQFSSSSKSSKSFKWLSTLAVAAAGLGASVAQAQDACAYRGDLDTAYCDANRDLVADTPTDAKKLRNPNTIVFTFTPIEEPAVYEKLFDPFTQHLAQCTGKRVVFFQVQSNAAQIEAMRAGRLHVAGFSTGATGFAVNVAGAVPFAVKSTENGPRDDKLIVISRKDGPVQTLADLKGKKVAHASPSSASGHLAPLALLPKVGVTPGKDYKILFSGKHDQSILGVASKDYDAATVAANVFHRMAARGTVKAADFNILYTSAPFPTASFAHAHDLAPELRDKLVGCFMNYKFTPEMTKAFEGDIKFIPSTYLKDFAIVRDVAAAAGESFGRAAYDKESSKSKK